MVEISRRALRSTSWLFASAIAALMAASALAQTHEVTTAPSDADSPPPQDSAAAPQKDCAGFIADRVDGWRLQKASVGATIVSATNSQQAYKANIVTLRHRNGGTCGAPHQQTKADFNVAYDAKQSKSKPGSAVNRIGNLQLQHLWFTQDDANYWVANADSFHNSSIGMYFQQAVGVGRGRMTPKHKIEATGERRLVSTTEIFGDLRVVHQRFYDQESDQLVGALVNLRYAYVTRRAAVYSVTLQALPIFNETDAWQAGAIIEVIAPLTDTVGISLAAFDTYVNNAPDKFRKNYLNLTIGLTFTPKPLKPL